MELRRRVEADDLKRIAMAIGLQPCCTRRRCNRRARPVSATSSLGSEAGCRTIATAMMSGAGRADGRSVEHSETKLDWTLKYDRSLLFAGTRGFVGLRALPWC
jgi:hypothetical protein